MICKMLFKIKLKEEVGLKAKAKGRPLKGESVKTTKE